MKRMKMVENYWKLLKIVENGWKRMIMIENGWAEDKQKVSGRGTEGNPANSHTIYSRMLLLILD